MQKRVNASNTVFSYTKNSTNTMLNNFNQFSLQCSSFEYKEAYFLIMWIPSRFAFKTCKSILFCRNSTQIGNFWETLPAHLCRLFAKYVLLCLLSGQLTITTTGRVCVGGWCLGSTKLCGSHKLRFGLKLGCVNIDIS